MDSVQAAIELRMKHRRIRAPVCRAADFGPGKAERGEA
jgi:hypothetical protein